MSNGHLVPTPRTDKNGVTRIRHMNPSQPAVSVSKLPPVTLPTVPVTHEQLVTDASSFLQSVFPYNTSSMDAMRARLKAYDDTTLRGITSLSKRRDSEALALTILGAINRGLGEAAINDLIHLEDVFRRNRIGDTFIHDHLEGLLQYDGMCPQESGKPYPELRREQCTAIAETLWHMERFLDVESVYSPVGFDNGYVPYLEDKALRDLMLHNPDRMKAVQIIKERGILNAKNIIGLLEADVDGSALSGGVL